MYMISNRVVIIREVWRNQIVFIRQRLIVDTWRVGNVILQNYQTCILLQFYRMIHSVRIT